MDPENLPPRSPSVSLCSIPSWHLTEQSGESCGLMKTIVFCFAAAGFSRPIAIEPLSAILKQSSIVPKSVKFQSGRPINCWRGTSAPLTIEELFGSDSE